jgi:hypothetical protein
MMAFPRPCPFVGIAEGLRSLVQRVRPADDGCHLPGFDDVLQEQKILLALRRRQVAQPLTDER